MVIDRIHGQTVQPGLKHLDRPQLAERLVQANEHVLANILDIIAAPKHAVHGSKYALLVGLDHGTKRSVVTALRLSDDFGINGHSKSCFLSRLQIAGLTIKTKSTAGLVILVQ